jgi:hypothetical protein
MSSLHRRRTDNTENTVTLPRRAHHIEFKSRDGYLTSPLVRWLLPSNELQAFALLLCARIAECLSSRCLAMRSHITTLKARFESHICNVNCIKFAPISLSNYKLYSYEIWYVCRAEGSLYLLDFYGDIHIYKTNSPWSWALLEKPPVAQLLKNFRTFYGTSKVHYCVHKSPPFIPILSQMNAVHTITFCCSEIHFNIILQRMSRPSYVYFLLAFLTIPTYIASYVTCTHTFSIFF